MIHVHKTEYNFYCLHSKQNQKLNFHAKNRDTFLPYFRDFWTKNVISDYYVCINRTNDFSFSGEILGYSQRKVTPAMGGLHNWHAKNDLRSKFYAHAGQLLGTSQAPEIRAKLHLALPK